MEVGDLEAIAVLFDKDVRWFYVGGRVEHIKCTNCELADSGCSIKHRGEALQMETMKSVVYGRLFFCFDEEGVSLSAAFRRASTSGSLSCHRTPCRMCQV